MVDTSYFGVKKFTFLQMVKKLDLENLRQAT